LANIPCPDDSPRCSDVKNNDPIDPNFVAPQYNEQTMAMATGRDRLSPWLFLRISVTIHDLAITHWSKSDFLIYRGVRLIAPPLQIFRDQTKNRDLRIHSATAAITGYEADRRISDARLKDRRGNDDLNARTNIEARRSSDQSDRCF
jgi:hypothetical protein